MSALLGDVAINDDVRGVDRATIGSANASRHKKTAALRGRNRRIIDRDIREGIDIAAAAPH